MAITVMTGMAASNNIGSNIGRDEHTEPKKTQSKTTNIKV